MVEYVDGSILAQLGNPDMRTPIAHALGWPERIALRCRIARPGGGRRGSTSRRRTCSGFRRCGLARAAAEAGGTAPAALNAANEVAVAAFLGGRLDFLGIPAIDRGRAGARHRSSAVRDLRDVLAGGSLGARARRDIDAGQRVPGQEHDDTDLRAGIPGGHRRAGGRARVRPFLDGAPPRHPRTALLDRLRHGLWYAGTGRRHGIRDCCNSVRWLRQAARRARRSGRAAAQLHAGIQPQAGLAPDPGAAGRPVRQFPVCGPSRTGCCSWWACRR